MCLIRFVVWILQRRTLYQDLFTFTVSIWKLTNLKHLSLCYGLRPVSTIIDTSYFTKLIFYCNSLHLNRFRWLIWKNFGTEILNWWVHRLNSTLIGICNLKRPLVLTCRQFWWLFILLTPLWNLKLLFFE